MRRGFKTEAEREAAQQRQFLGLSINEPLLARRLINYHGLLLLTPQSIPGMKTEHLFQLLEADESAWSAVSILVGTQIAIIYNTSHSAGRQESDLTHEVAHLLCKHEPMYLVPLPGLPLVLRTYNVEQEDEANWLTGCLKLPREALLWAVRNGMDNTEIATYFQASLQLVEYRRRITGIDKQLGYARWN